jgi:hypothetical protein
LSYWVIRDLSLDTRKKIKVYAAENDLTIPQAITKLIEIALSK